MIHNKAIAIVLFLFSSLTVQLLSAQETCMFQSLDVETGPVRSQVAVADFDGSGLDDFAIPTPDGLRVYLNQGDSSFVLGSSVGEESLFAIVACDLDGDMDIDIAASSIGNVFTFLNLGDGTFTPGPASQTPILLDIPYVDKMCFGDFDSDGDVDLIGINTTVFTFDLNGLVAKFTNQGSGSFLVETGVVDGLPSSCALVDFDNDQDLDFLVTGLDGLDPGDLEGQFLLFENNGGIDISESLNIATSKTGPRSIVSGDFDGDSDTDFAVLQTISSFLGNSVEIWINDGGSGISLGPIFELSDEIVPFGGLYSMCVSDIDGDSNLDLIVSNLTDGNFAFLRNLGGLSFDVSTSPVETSFSELAVGNFDNQDFLDLVVRSSTNSVSVLRSSCFILGDLNDDESVNLLDVAPFTNLLINDLFQAEADINLDGSLDLLDVVPFVELVLN